MTAVSASLGYAEHAGDRFKVTRISLRHGFVRFEFIITGPRAACDGPVRFYDELGFLTFSSHLMRFAAVPRQVAWDFKYDLSVDVMLTSALMEDIL